MKVLFGNNYFYLRGGAERVFFEEAALLRAHGHDTVYFSTQSDRNLESEFASYFVSELKLSLRNMGRFIYCRESRRKLRKLIVDTSPDIAHLHNIYQDLSPSILPELRMHGIPVILTLHDYKIICPNYTMSHGGRICEDCRGGRFYRCVTNRCKQGSLGKSLVIAMEAYVHRWMDIWGKNVTKFIAPSSFMKEKMVSFGWDAGRIEVVSNFIDLRQYRAGGKAGDYFLFLGRLAGEKGVATLVDAFMGCDDGARLVIAGGGPLEEALKGKAAGDARISFAGHLAGEALRDAIVGSRAVVVPSEWYENAPMSVLEAMAYGKPVIGARIGGIPEMIEEGVTGFLFESGNVKELRKKLDLVGRMAPTGIEQMGRAARAYVEKFHSAERHYSKLMDVYSEVLGH